MVRYISLIVAFLCLVSNAFSQEKKTYVFKDRYTKSVQNFINQSSHFEDIKIMTGNMLTSDKNKVDYKKVENNLKKLYPSENASGMLCIDLEHSGYNALKGNSITRFKKVSDKQFKEAEKEFIQLIKLDRKSVVKGTSVGLGDQRPATQGTKSGEWPRAPGLSS